MGYFLLSGMNKANYFFIEKKYVEFSIIMLSTVLLGVWAVKDTIALRNIILFIGAILGVIYFYRELTCRRNKFYFSISDQLPLILITIMFIWVLIHATFLSDYPKIEINEIQSIWLRSFLAVILAVATGHVVVKKHHLANFIWIGILLSFVVVCFQYISKVRDADNIFLHLDYYGKDSYIYLGKINAVLMGTILLSTSIGGLIDLYRMAYKSIENKYHPEVLYFFTLMTILSTAIVIFSYLYIFNARNGVLLFACLLIGSLPFGFYCLIRRVKHKFTSAVLLSILSSTILGMLVYKQSQLNSGWGNIIEDVSIAVQIDKFPHWSNLKAMGYPLTETGRSLRENNSNSTYERVAWAVAGAHLIPKNQLGVGGLNGVFPRIMMSKYPNLTAPSTHSAWIEFTLALGIPALILMISPLLIIFYRSIKYFSSSHFGTTAAMLSGALLVLYSIGELSTGHAVEILFYMTALLSVLSSRYKYALS
jgi:hypothetical protein